MCIIDTETGIIRICRGDDICIPLFIDCGNDDYSSRYTLGDNDTIFFALMQPNQRFECAILLKTFTKDSQKTEDGDILIKIDSKDTENLFGGKYYYMIKLQTHDEGGNKTICTLVPNREFYIEG